MVAPRGDRVSLPSGLTVATRDCFAAVGDAAFAESTNDWSLLTASTNMVAAACGWLHRQWCRRRSTVLARQVERVAGLETTWSGLTVTY